MINYLSLIISLLHLASSTIYFVIPDHHPSHHYSNNNTFTLQHYLNNTNRYFVSHNQLHFLPGHYYINSDLIFKEITDFTLTGNGTNQSFIVCPSPASIVVTNVDVFTFQNISLIDCMTLSETDTSSGNYYHVSIYIYHCGSIVLHNLYVNLSVSAPAGLTAIHVRNVAKSRIINVIVQLSIIICHNHPIKVNGLGIYYSSSNNNIYYMRQPYVKIENFHYHTQKSCLKYSQCAIAALIVHISEFYHFIIQNTVFTNLSNSSAFCYYGIADSKSEDATMRSVLIKNVTVCYNTGYDHLKMFRIELYSFDSPNSEAEASNDLYFNEPVRLYNMLKFQNCNFTRNTNIDAMIYIRPSTYTKIEGHVTVSNSIFHNNKDVNFIKVTRDSQNIPNVITHVTLDDVTVSCNEHHYDESDMIFITNGRMYFSNIVFTTNHYFDNLIHLQASLLYFKQSSQILKNYARHIIKAQGGSFLFIDHIATVSISNNVVYKVVKHVSTMDTSAVPICPLQVYVHDSTHDNHMHGINCTFILLNNTEMISKSLQSEIISFINKTCVWLESAFFKKTNASAVYHKIMKFNKIFINQTAKRIVPLSVCPCFQNSSYNCYAASLGSLFPGQTLRVKLIVSQRWSQLSSMTIIVANTKDDDCMIADSNQLSQSHLTSHGCNNYSYTIWSNSRFITECKLFIGLNEMPEMFFVQMKPCPVGFTLQSSKKSCYCDELLMNNDILSIVSCNLDDETILRPPNSWISADTKNGSYTYDVSSQCPFDYCSPYSSHLNLSNPDTQCQLDRSGVVCAECKQGLSTVFGSSYCKPCSNIYLLIIVPMAIVGIVLVIMLFTFNLTVTNGIINTLIFYVNIISINYSQFCFERHSPDCTILSLFNLDLGIETCFYDGMDGYTKMWLQLAFPAYLMIIAFTLIIGSRHSYRLQRLTGTRVLKVLATLFLLSYTKILLTVCQVLFFFSTVTHLPNNQTTLVWSVDTGVKLFGVKFCILYSVCLGFFIILLIFNFLLLFPRMVSRWSFINYFKPLLDAYFGPYKQNYPFWTGLQLSIRSCFFGLSALPRNISLSSGAVLVGIVLCAHGILHPF